MATKTFTSIPQAIQWIIEHPEDKEDLFRIMPHLEAAYNAYMATQAYDEGKIGANELLRSYGDPSLQMTPEMEKYIDNQIARENTANDQAYQREMRDTSLTSAGKQLEQLGLSTSNVISTGGASSGVSSAAASNNMHSVAQLQQQERINRFNQKMGLAKSLIGAASSMASSGIYGAALGAVKNAGSKIAGSAAHSGLQALQTFGKFRNTDSRNFQFAPGGNNADGYLL